MKQPILLFCILLASCFAKVINLDARFFEKLQERGRNILLLVNSPVSPEFKRVNDMFYNFGKFWDTDPMVIIATADEVNEVYFSDFYKIESYPTILLIPDGKARDAILYEGGYNENELMEFINTKLDYTYKFVQYQATIHNLDDDQFGPFVKRLRSSSRPPHIVIKFYKHFCNYCIEAAEYFRMIAELYVGRESEIVFVEVDGSRYKKISNEWGIAKYPSFRIFKPNGDIASFDGKKSKMRVLEWIENETLVSSSTGSPLSSEVDVLTGTIPLLDNYVRRVSQRISDPMSDQGKEWSEGDLSELTRLVRQIDTLDKDLSITCYKRAIKLIRSKGLVGVGDAVGKAISALKRKESDIERIVWLNVIQSFA